MNTAVKTWKSFHDQLDLLQSRNLIIKDEARALSYLARIGYYRLSGYFYPFRQWDVQRKQRLDLFSDGITFEHILQLYIFDKKLRLLAIDALERIEVAMRVDIAYLLGEKAPLAHADSQYFDEKFNHADWYRRYEELLQRAAKSQTFVNHHLQKYGTLPVWACCEVWDFGTMSKLFKGMQAKDKLTIAKKYRIKDGSHLATYLHGFNFIRNVAAHHDRLWNRKMIGRATFKGLPDVEWRQLSADKVFPYFCLMQWMLQRICPHSRWHHRFQDLLLEFPQVPDAVISLHDFGMDTNLQNWPLWNRQ